MENGQKLLNIGYLSFFLPDDFDGDIADALELLADHHRQKVQEGKSEKTKVSDWENSLKNFKNGKRLTANWGLSEYDKKGNAFVRVDGFVKFKGTSIPYVDSLGKD